MKLSLLNVKALSFVLAVTLSACGVPQRSAKVLDIKANTVSAVTYPADLRGAYMQTGESKVQFCAEPAPDVALQSLVKVTENLKATTPSGIQVEGSASGEFAAKVIQLAGRTQLVLLAREMLYRACELALNHDTDKNTAVELYKAAGELVKDLGQADKARAKADLARSAETLKKAGVTIDKTIEKFLTE